MRKLNRIPRILKINEIQGFKVFCAFNNGEHRIIDFNDLFERWKTQSHPFQKGLLDPKIFSKVQLHEGTLRWSDLTQKIKLSNGMKFDVPLEFDPIVLYEASLPDIHRNERLKIGGLIKATRKKLGLTQSELAQKSGTTKNYISRIENDKSDIELNTLRKIIEIGFDKQMEINIL